MLTLMLHMSPCEGISWPSWPPWPGMSPILPWSMWEWSIVLDSRLRSAGFSRVRGAKVGAKRLVGRAVGRLTRFGRFEAEASSVGRVPAVLIQ